MPSDASENAKYPTETDRPMPAIRDYESPDTCLQGMVCTFALLHLWSKQVQQGKRRTRFGASRLTLSYKLLAASGTMQACS